MTVSDPNVSRVLSINQRTRKILQSRVIPAHKNPPNDAELLELIFSISKNSVGVILEETGGGGGGRASEYDLRHGGGVHTNSFAMIMFLCVCGSSLHASSSL